MNKKANFTLQSMGFMIFVIITIGIILFGIYWNFVLFKQFTAYSKFCKTHNDICYCSLLDGCSFKLSYSSSSSYINGVYSSGSSNNNIQELCALAKNIDDKEMLFEANCPK